MTVSSSVETFFQTQYPQLLTLQKISTSQLDEVIAIENDLLSTTGSSEKIQDFFKKLSELKLKAEPNSSSSKEFFTKFNIFCEKLTRIENIAKSSLSEPTSPTSTSPEKGSPLTGSETKRKERSRSDPTKKLIEDTQQEIKKIKDQLATLVLKDIPGIQERVAFLLNESIQQAMLLSKKTKLPNEKESLLETQTSLTTIQQDLNKIQSLLTESKKVLGSEAAKNDVSRDFGIHLGALVNEVAVTEENFLSNITVLKKMYTEEVKGNPFTANVAKSFQNAEQLDTISKTLTKISESTDSIYEKVGQLTVLYKSEEFSNYYFHNLLPLLEQHSVITEIIPLIMGKEALETLKSTTGLAATHKKQHSTALEELKKKGDDKEAIQEVKAKIEQANSVLGKRNIFDAGFSEVFQRVTRHPLLCDSLKKEIDRHIEKLKKEVQTEIPENQKTTIEAEIKQFEALSSELHQAHEAVSSLAKKVEAAKPFYEPIGLLRAYLLTSSDPIRTDLSNKELEAFIQNVVQPQQEHKFTIASKREDLEKKLRGDTKVEPQKRSLLSKLTGKKEQGSISKKGQVRLEDAPKIATLISEIENIGMDPNSPDNQIILQSLKRSIYQLCDEAKNNPEWEKNASPDIKYFLDTVKAFHPPIQEW